MPTAHCSSCSTTSPTPASAPPTVKKPQARRPAPLKDFASNRPRSFSVCPPPSPSAFDEDALDRPASTAPGRRSVASTPGPDDSVDTSFQSIEFVVEPPSSAASSSRSRTPSPAGRRQSAAIPIRPPTYFAPSASAGKCFQEQIQPLVYFDVQHPSTFGHFSNPYLVAEPTSRFPAVAVAPQHVYSPSIPYYEVYPEVQYPYITSPPSPMGGTCPVDPSFSLVQPSSPFAPHPPAFQSHIYEPASFQSAWPIPNQYLDTASPPFVSPPASPGLSNDGATASSTHEQAKPSLTAIESTTGTVYPLVPTAEYPVPPTVRGLLARGDHFFSSGTCKFFDVLKGYGFIIDDHKDLAADVFVHYTGIDVPRGFRCLTENERVEYVLTNHSAGGYQALRVIGEFGAPLKGLSDEGNAKAVCRTPIQRQSTPVAGAPNALVEPATVRKPVPLAPQQQANWKPPHMRTPQPRKNASSQSPRSYSRLAFAPRAA
ncbi:hypothetical protein JCM3775_003877 [Rhodotorula graminis]